MSLAQVPARPGELGKREANIEEYQQDPVASAQTPRYVRRTLIQQTVDVLELNPRSRTIHTATQIRACWCPGGTADFRGVR